MKSNNLFNVLMYTAVGIAIGAVVCTLSLLAVHGMTDVLRELTVWLIASAVLGLVSMVYESEHFTDLTATLIHAPVTLAVALIAGWILDYGDGSILLLLTRMVPAIIVLYALIHLFLFVMRRCIVCVLNSHLKK